MPITRQKIIRQHTISLTKNFTNSRGFWVFFPLFFLFSNICCLLCMPWLQGCIAMNCLGLAGCGLEPYTCSSLSQPHHTCLIKSTTLLNKQVSFTTISAPLHLCKPFHIHDFTWQYCHVIWKTQNKGWTRKKMEYLNGNLLLSFVLGGQSKSWRLTFLKHIICPIYAMYYSYIVAFLFGRHK